MERKRHPIKIVYQGSDAIPNLSLGRAIMNAKVAVKDATEAVREAEGTVATLTEAADKRTAGIFKAFEEWWQDYLHPILVNKMPIVDPTINRKKFQNPNKRSLLSEEIIYSGVLFGENKEGTFVQRVARCRYVYREKSTAKTLTEEGRVIEIRDNDPLGTSYLTVNLDDHAIVVYDGKTGSMATIVPNGVGYDYNYSIPRIQRGSNRKTSKAALPSDYMFRIIEEKSLLLGHTAKISTPAEN